jgi:hypothetical protein
MLSKKELAMRHVTGFSNSTKIRYIVNGFGMYGTINDIYTKTATVSHGEALRLAIQKLAYDRRRSSFRGEGRPVGVSITHEGVQVQIDLMAN